MSSLAATKADGFYYPPDWDPAKGSINKLHNRHPLADRARKLKKDGILIIRFEMPFNVWCLKCGELIGKGVRFNAEKKQIGFYLGNRVWSFVMRHHCGCRLEIHTDPKNTEYTLVEGIRRKIEDYAAEDAQVIELSTVEEREELEDPLKGLEHKTMQRRKAKAQHHKLAALREETTMTARHDAALNRLARAQLRIQKKKDARAEQRRKELGLPENIRLLEGTKGDREEAARVTFGISQNAAGSWKSKRRAVLSSSIFFGRSLKADGDHTGSNQKIPVDRSVHSRWRTAGGVKKDYTHEKSRTLAKRTRLGPNVKLKLSSPS